MWTETAEREFEVRQALRILQPVIRGFLARTLAPLTATEYLRRHGYKPLRKLGQGVFGEVWRAQSEDQSAVAIKRQNHEEMSYDTPLYM